MIRIWHVNDSRLVRIKVAVGMMCLPLLSTNEKPRHALDVQRRLVEGNSEYDGAGRVAGNRELVCASCRARVFASYRSGVRE
jgi:hypothetical protein